MRLRRLLVSVMGLTCVVALAGCAERNRAEVESRQSSMLGRSVDDAFREYGLPNITRPHASGGTEMYWQRRNALLSGRGIAQVYTCDLRMVANAARTISEIAFIGRDTDCLVVFGPGSRVRTF